MIMTEVVNKQGSEGPYRHGMTPVQRLMVRWGWRAYGEKVGLGSEGGERSVRNVRAYEDLRSRLEATIQTKLQEGLDTNQIEEYLRSLDFKNL